ncbi:exonuclease domain-containing protein [Aegicerativicinus sediminis]|uniref:exonuclease domain-containing protein n=1 Tax=Aegicerativicinus sediminis TaxID=2893202 RepID=UPI00293BE5A3|nr:exonuclease domain-containing protein [Aegicerativicinus sediminis]
METTGGKYNQEGITEIAIYKFDGHEVVDQFISLVNPEREIQPFVTNLTGINSTMLKSAPKFYEVAKRIIEITEDCVLVAHNASFDYRILRTEFKRLGYSYKRKSLCTVELAKTLIPGQPSYSLGKLARSLGIPVSDRHRAQGDALATVKLFKMLLTKDLEKYIVKDAINVESAYSLKKAHKDIIDALPILIGVFYIHDTNGEIIYVGRSNNIKQKINQILTDIDPFSQKIQQLIATVTYDSCGNEMISHLVYHEEIKKNNPLFNKTATPAKPKFALYTSTDSAGYHNLYLDAYSQKKNPITSFNDKRSGNYWLNTFIEKYQLCMDLCGIKATETGCFNYHVNQCNGACIGDEGPNEYNKRFQLFLDDYKLHGRSLAIVDKGREIGEKGIIYLENNAVKGYGFIDLNYQLKNKSILERIISEIEPRNSNLFLIQAYLRKNKNYKIIELE